MKKGSANTRLAHVFVGIGSNLHDPIRQVSNALEALQYDCHVSSFRASKLYRNPPMGPAEQPDYVNAVAAFQSHLQPDELLDCLQALESAAGRFRDGVHWGPRVLDLDILLYDGLMLNTERLNIPHPGLTQRAFVVVPLHELSPDLVVPGRGALKIYAERYRNADLQPVNQVHV